MECRVEPVSGAIERKISKNAVFFVGIGGFLLYLSAIGTGVHPWKMAGTA
jgi:hypothetical protein